MKTPFGAPRLTVLGFRPGDNFEVFRIVRGADTEDPVLLNSLRSNFALSDEPRKVERDSTLIHMGISVHLDAEAAKQTALKWWPKIGDHVARIRLGYGHGFSFAHTGRPPHLTLWADPIKLHDAIADIAIL